VNLVLGGHFDVAVRDVVMSIAAFTLARLIEVGDEAPVHDTAVEPRPGHVIA
jgi:hypothetical protein